MKRTTWEAGSTANGLPEFVGDDDAGQAVLGEQAGGVEGVGVGGDHREVLGEFRGAHVQRIRRRSCWEFPVVIGGGCVD